MLIKGQNTLTWRPPTLIFMSRSTFTGGGYDNLVYQTQAWIWWDGTAGLHAVDPHHLAGAVGMLPVDDPVGVGDCTTGGAWKESNERK